MTDKRVSAIIFNDKKILLIHRIKNGSEYFVLPGGSVEKEEDNMDALMREVKEETNLDIQVGKELWQIKSNADVRTQHIFLASKFMGALMLGSPEKERQSDNNKYILEWHDIVDLKNITFYPCEIVKNLIMEFV
ncbi:MAG: NUDIX domain-containing protein [Patescibacteria group bacterium]